MTDSFSYYDLLDACGEPGCPVCHLAQHGVKRYLEALFYERVNDPYLRDHLRQSLGFCHDHAWQIIHSRLPDSLGIAIIYRDILTTLLEKLPEIAPDNATTTLFRLVFHSYTLPAAVQICAKLTPTAACPACTQYDQISERVTDAFIKALEDKKMVAAFKESDGLCLPHFRQALGMIDNTRALKRLLALMRPKLEAINEELSELIRKNDYRFMKEGFGKERDSWIRSVAMMTGSKKRDG